MQITCKTSGVYRVQHVMYYVGRRDSLAVEFNRAEITFSLALFHWLKLLVSFMHLCLENILIR